MSAPSNDLVHACPGTVVERPGRVTEANNHHLDRFIGRIRAL